MAVEIIELNNALNSWPDGTVGYYNELEAINGLDEIGKKIGYGRLLQLAYSLRDIQCDGADLEKFRKARERRLDALK